MFIRNFCFQKLCHRFIATVTFWYQLESPISPICVRYPKPSYRTSVRLSRSPHSSNKFFGINFHIREVLWSLPITWNVDTNFQMKVILGKVQVHEIFLLESYFSCRSDDKYSKITPASSDWWKLSMRRDRSFSALIIFDRIIRIKR